MRLSILISLHYLVSFSIFCYPIRWTFLAPGEGVGNVGVEVVTLFMYIHMRHTKHTNIDLYPVLSLFT